MNFERLDYVLPEWAIYPIINGDYSALNDEEEEKLNTFLFSLPEGHFCPPEEEGYFKWGNDIESLGGIVYDVIFMQVIK